MRSDQSGETHADFAFPRSYEIQERYELPGSGRSEIPTFYIPAPRFRIEHDGLWVTVRPSNGQKWTGVFAYGYDEPPGISRIMSSPDPDSFIVISKGAAYLVGADNPNRWEQLPVFPVTDVVASEKHNILVFADFSKLVAYGPSGLRWKTSLLCPDSLKIVSVDCDSIGGTGYDPGSDTGTANFVVDLDTGADRLV